MQPIVEFSAVDETGERIMTRLVGQRAFEAPFLRNIVKYDDRADHPALPVADGCRRLLDRHFLPGPCDEHGMVRRRTSLTAAQRAHQWILDRLTRDLVDEIQDLADRTSARLRQTPRRKRFGDRIDVLDAAFRICAD